MEGQLGGALEQVTDARLVVHARQLHHDAGGALALNQRLGDAEAVDALADDLLGADERLLDLRPEVGLDVVVLGARRDLSGRVAEVARQARARPLGLDGVGEERHEVLVRGLRLLGGDRERGVERVVGAGPGEFAEERARAHFERHVHAALEVEAELEGLLAGRLDVVAVLFEVRGALGLIHGREVAVVEGVLEGREELPHRDDEQRRDRDQFESVALHR